MQLIQNVNEKLFEKFHNWKSARRAELKFILDITLKNKCLCMSANLLSCGQDSDVYQVV